MRKKTLLFSLLIGLGSTLAVSAQPLLSPRGEPIVIEMPAPAICPSTALARGGELLVAWEADRTIFSQRFSAAGEPLTEIESHPSTAGFLGESPVVAAGPDGSFFLVWEGVRVETVGPPAVFYFETYLQRVQSAGALWREPRLLFDAERGYPFGVYYPFPRLAVAADGSLAILGDLDVDGRLLVLRLPAPGLVPEVWVVAEPSLLGPDSELAIAAGSDNAMVALWEVPFDGFGTGTVAARIDPAGVSGAGILVSQDPSDSEDQPQIAGLHDGGFLALWREHEAASNISRLMARRLDAAGEPVGDEVEVDAGVGEIPDQPRLAALGDGTALAVWESHGLTDGAVFLRARVLGADGAARGSEMTLASVTGGLQACPAVAASPAGAVVVTWKETADDGSQRIVAQRFEPEICADDTLLCLRGGRYVADVRWRDPVTHADGEGHAVALTADAGAFWFSEPASLALGVKLVDGGAVNGHDWVFFGGLTEVEFLLRVTDTATGLMRSYHNPPWRRASIGDTEAFAATGMLDAEPIPCPKQRAEPVVLLGRFQVEIAWKDFLGQSGAGQGVALSDDTLYAWFFTPDNVELLLEIHDGRAENGHFWFFLGSLSNVEYRITITDTFTGAVYGYVNLLGEFASGADLRAFPG